MDTHDGAIERDLQDALRRLNAATTVPPIDPARQAALFAAFDAAPRPSASPRQYWYLAAFATAAAVLIAAGVTPALTGRHGPLPAGSAQHRTLPLTNRDVQPQPPTDFVLVPGAAALPPMESGTLLRVDLPASVLPSYGLTPPPGGRTTVRTDLIVGQDGLTRAARIVN